MQTLSKHKLVRVDVVVSFSIENTNTDISRKFRYFKGCVIAILKVPEIL